MVAASDSARGEDSGLTYADALAVLDGALTFGINPSLGPVTAMAEELGRPQDAFVSVQVTGTNGKSSTARLVAAILRAHGLRVGLYTSPELDSYTERIEVDGAPVSEEVFATGVREALAAAARAAVEPTEFEILTAAALWVFRQEGVDFAVLEVGMGGRWDATSVVTPAVSVITGVGLDHTAHLGETREAIAADKAHIIKEGSTPVLGPGTAGVEWVFLEHAAACGTGAQVMPSARAARAVRPEGGPSPVTEERTLRYRLLAHPDTPDGATVLDVRSAHATYSALAVHAPAYQAANVATAIAAAEAALGRALDQEATRVAIAATRFPGRFEVVAHDPWVIVDGAHNPEAAAVLAEAVRDAWKMLADPQAGEQEESVGADGLTRATSGPVIVLGVLADKDLEGIVAALAPVAFGFVCVAPDSPRALAAHRVAEVVERMTGMAPRIASTVAEGLDLACKEGAASMLVTGSIRTAAEGRRAGNSRAMVR